jgi:hypothetical protein
MQKRGDPRRSCPHYNQVLHDKRVFQSLAKRFRRQGHHFPSNPDHVKVTSPGLRRQRFQLQPIAAPGPWRNSLQGSKKREGPS